MATPLKKEGISMYGKKILMLMLLIILIIGIAIAIIKINEKLKEKLSENTQELNTVNNETAIASSTGKVRRTTEKVEADTNNIIEITDNYFIESTNDVYLNLDDYIGKTIKLEGLVYSYQDKNGDTCYAVVRNTPGCCGNDGLAGLDIRYDEEYPELDTWVEVIGVVGTDTMYGQTIPALQVVSITEKEKGTEFVTN